MVLVVPGRLEAPGKTLAQGKEMEGSLDLLLRLLWESTQLRQEDIGEEVLLRQLKVTCQSVSVVT